MSGFIDINRLDYVDPEQIYIPEEFRELEQLHTVFRSRMVKFLLNNNFKKQHTGRHPISFLLFRVHFRDAWEWHIPAELSQILNEIKIRLHTASPCRWDCIWILKHREKSRIPVYFCDIVIFLSDNSVLKTFRDCIVRQFQNSGIVSEIKVLDRQDITSAELENICLPDKSCGILKCEFAHDIPVCRKQRSDALNAVSAGTQLREQAENFSTTDL